MLERELDLKRVRTTLAQLAVRRLVFENPQRVTPLALPLIADQMRSALSTEKLADRIARMQLAMQKPVVRGRHHGESAIGKRADAEVVQSGRSMTPPARAGRRGRSDR